MDDTSSGSPADEGRREWSDEAVRIRPYDPEWPRRFEREREALDCAIGGWAVGGIHHVGSTAVPGLDAKPIVDVLVGLRDLGSSRAAGGPRPSKRAIRLSEELRAGRQPTATASRRP